MGTSSVFELRQYTLHPGQREVLIDVFDRELVESQEEAGMQVVGQFRDLDRPDRFVWVRGFADMPARHAALTSFYSGPVWAEHKDVANATMRDFDDVRLLRPLTPGTTFPESETPRAPIGSSHQPQALVTATLYRLAAPVSAAALELVIEHLDPLLDESGAARLALLQTEPAENTYKALPVREGEHVLVRFARFDGAEAHAEHHRELQRSHAWDAAQRQLHPNLLAPPSELRLQPTARSLIQ
jgi:quinol monooxygenase YgiN